MNTVEYVQGADLPDLAISWYDTNNALIDFTTGYTFELKIGNPGVAALVTKTGGFSAFPTAPNLIVGWANSGELNTLAPGNYRGQIKATRTADLKQRFLTFNFKVAAGVL